MWLASHSLGGAAPTGRNRDCRRCRLAARSWLRPPTADSARRERSLRSYSSAPASTRRWSRRQMPQRPMHQGSPNAIDRSVGSRREESAPVAFRLRRAAACSDGGQRPKPGPSLHMRGTVRCLRPWFAVDDHFAGLPVTQCRPWPAEDVWSEPCAAPARYTGAGKWAERFHAASSRPAIRAARTTPRASAASHLSPNRIPYSPRARAQREYERRPFSGSRKSSSDGQGRRCVGSRIAARDSAGAPRGHPVIRYVVGVDTLHLRQPGARHDWRARSETRSAAAPAGRWRPWPRRTPHWCRRCRGAPTCTPSRSGRGSTPAVMVPAGRPPRLLMSAKLLLS